MQPGMMPSKPTGESFGIPYKVGESLPGNNESNVEQLSDNRIETDRSTAVEAAKQSAMQAATSASNTALPSSPSPTPVSNVAFTTNPVIAADGDLIEKEWVDRAKQIVTETRDQPRLREERTSELKRDYLGKRFGREIGVSKTE